MSESLGIQDVQRWERPVLRPVDKGCSTVGPPSSRHSLSPAHPHPPDCQTALCFVAACRRSSVPSCTGQERASQVQTPANRTCRVSPKSGPANRQQAVRKQ
jgi:hypothetical protein